MPYDKNVPAVPEYKASEIIKAIERKVMSLEDIEKMEVADIVNYHSCEASVIAEKISELLGVSYSAIFELF
jgi:hypothetical protein